MRNNRICLEMKAIKANSWLARDVTYVSIIGYPPCWCSNEGEIYICVYVIVVVLLEISMNSSENGIKIYTNRQSYEK